MQLRMGTHPSGPATVMGTEGTSLTQWLSTHASALGDAPLYFGNDIPFLFKVDICPQSHLQDNSDVFASLHKRPHQDRSSWQGVCKRRIFLKSVSWMHAFCVAQVLSVETALSIQSHPDKALAKKLHAERPDVCPISFIDIRRVQPNPLRSALSNPPASCTQG